MHRNLLALQGLRNTRGPWPLPFPTPATAADADAATAVLVRQISQEAGYAVTNDARTGPCVTTRQQHHNRGLQLLRPLPHSCIPPRHPLC